MRCPELGESTVPDTGTRCIPYVPDAQDVPEDGGKDLLREDAALLDRLHEELLHNLQLAQVRLLAVDDLGYGLENNEVQVDLISNFKVK